LTLGFTVAAPTPATGAAEATRTSRRAWLVVAFAALFFLYVGTENAVSGWISFYSVPIYHSEYRAMTSASIFWSAFLAGRLLSPLYLRQSKNHVSVFISVTVALTGIVTLFFASGPWVLGAAALLSGFGLAVIYPILITEMAAGLGRNSRAATACFAFSGLGAAVLPWLSGRISEESGKIKAGLILPAFVLIVLISLYSTLVSRHHKSASLR
jgi:FHS family glucose/mannose:H+ symporter-like MFS transporter